MKSCAKWRSLGPHDEIAGGIIQLVLVEIKFRMRYEVQMKFVKYDND